MTPIEEESRKLWDFDLLHYGNLCQRIREARLVTAADIALWCGGLSNSTISTEIEKKGKGGRKNFECYLKALQATDLNGKPVNARISSKEAKILSDLYQTREQKMNAQCQLAAISFQDIKRDPSPRLKELLSALAKEERPAFIMDPLWFIHAINGAAFNLFAIDPDAKYLNDWKAWHVVAAKFWPEFVVRKAHHNIQEFFPPTIDYFLKYPATYPFLFTWQMRNLIYEMYLVSEHYNLEFTQWWLQATSFNLPYDMDAGIRTILYKQEWIQANPLIRDTREVELALEYTLTYTLAVWNPFGTSDFNAFVDILKSPKSQTIYYAADYDKDNNFHVNTWLRVKEKIEQWMSKGNC